jgi:hypothetical protein
MQHINNKMENIFVYSKKSNNCFHLRDLSLFQIGNLPIKKQSIFINILIYYYNLLSRVFTLLNRIFLKIYFFKI